MANTHGVVEMMQTQSQQIDAYRKSFKYSGGTLDNGNVITLGAPVNATDSREVFVAATPTSTTVANHVLWIVDKPRVATTIDGYKGLNPDPRAVFVDTDEVSDCARIKEGDIIGLSSTAISGTRTNEGFVDLQTTGILVWAGSSTSATVFKLLEAYSANFETGRPETFGLQMYRLQAVTG